jgi:hypothetical protein
MSKSIFLSYRREDSAGHTGRLHDRLVQKWGAERIFWDIDNIDPGVDFVEAIDQTLDKCPVVVVVIGPHWLSADASGRRRIDQELDFHRLEVERALSRKVRVIPALVGGAQMPSAESLPQSIRTLSRRNAFEITDKRFAYDASKLADAIEKALATGPEQQTALSSTSKGELRASLPTLGAAVQAPSPGSSDLDRQKINTHLEPSELADSRKISLGRTPDESYSSSVPPSSEPSEPTPTESNRTQRNGAIGLAIVSAGFLIMAANSAAPVLFLIPAGVGIAVALLLLRHRD